MHAMDDDDDDSLDDLGLEEELDVDLELANLSDSIALSDDDLNDWAEVIYVASSLKVLSVSVYKRPL